MKTRVVCHNPYKPYLGLGHFLVPASWGPYCLNLCIFYRHIVCRKAMGLILEIVVLVAVPEIATVTA